MRARRFAVIGDPVGHSKSPAMHGAAFHALGLPHTYEAVRVSSAELAHIVGELRKGRFDGLNVTVPHKQRVLPLVDVLDDTTRLAGAANTLVRRDDGTIVAHNTDVPALAGELQRISRSGLREVDRPWAPVRALVLGSGGAARAAVVALSARLGVRDIAVRARSFTDSTRRDAFLATAPCPVTAQPWAPSEDSERATEVLVQATSAGMRGGEPGEAVAEAVAWDKVPAGAVALDVVYSPRDTPWLRAARDRGLRCDDGLGMLARQGALAFELWLGIDAPIDVMRAALDKP
ncbi:MAG TPA: shikimate dehydrogenase [Polyangiaceae bacterium]|nr:shikimate dehydrogenase [Polyangiaceae bacterium]